MTRHYHVIENTPGYLPDTDQPPFAYTSRRAAESYAKDLADEYREHGEFVKRWHRPRFGEPFMAEVWVPEYRISGNRRDGYFIEDRTRMHDLGRVVDIVECSEAQCMEEDW